MHDDLMRALNDARALAMNNTAGARVPECGDFGAIAQNLDWAINELQRRFPELAGVEKSPVRIPRASIAYNGHFNSLLINYATARATGSDDESDQAYEKLVAQIDTVTYPAPAQMDLSLVPAVPSWRDRIRDMQRDIPDVVAGNTNDAVIRCAMKAEIADWRGWHTSFMRQAACAWMTANDWGKEPLVTFDVTVASGWVRDSREVTSLCTVPLRRAIALSVRSFDVWWTMKAIEYKGRPFTSRREAAHEAWKFAMSVSEQAAQVKQQKTTGETTA